MAADGIAVHRLPVRRADDRRAGPAAHASSSTAAWATPRRRSILMRLKSDLFDLLDARHRRHARRRSSCSGTAASRSAW
ncbi:MAG: hypothetical protein MZW92_33640 [Comamonadaceae bacterium]|nr:hypothetical protein [Comamonadaceae bacterium]